MDIQPSTPPAGPPAPAAQATAAQTAEDAQYYRGVLHGLIDMGADIARMIHQDIKAQAESAPTEAGAGAQAVAAFERIARTVRRTILLARAVAEPARGRAAGQDRVAARKSILRAVEDCIGRTRRGAEAEALHGELLDRLDAPDLEDEIGHRPTADLIAEICRDLGLHATAGTDPWKRRTPADVAALCARAAMPAGARPPRMPFGGAMAEAGTRLRHAPAGGLTAGPGPAPRWSG